ncbi:MAG: nitroreductase family protein [bacterium]|nr:nitroreductase family protein [bacterium]
MLEHNDYESLKFICERRKSCRDFQDKPVSKDIIKKILHLADMAPFASEKKNWRVQTIRDKSLIEKIADAVDIAANKIKDNIKEDYKFGYSKYAESFLTFRSAPILFIPTFRVEKSLSSMLNNDIPFIDAWEKDNYTKSISCVSILIIMAAESLGLASSFMTGPLIAEKTIMNLIDIRPGRHIGSIIPIGYPGTAHK